MSREWGREPSFIDPCVGPMSACECRRCLRLGTITAIVVAVGVAAFAVWAVVFS